MLKDRKKTKTIIKTLRYAAKSGCVIRFERNEQFRDVLQVGGGNNGKEQFIVFNEFFLYRHDKSK